MHEKNAPFLTAPRLGETSPHVDVRRRVDAGPKLRFRMRGEKPFGEENGDRLRHRRGTVPDQDSTHWYLSPFSEQLRQCQECGLA